MRVIPADATGSAAARQAEAQAKVRNTWFPAVRSLRMVQPLWGMLYRKFPEEDRESIQEGLTLPSRLEDSQ